MLLHHGLMWSREVGISVSARRELERSSPSHKAKPRINIRVSLGMETRGMLVLLEIIVIGAISMKLVFDAF